MRFNHIFGALDAMGINTPLKKIALFLAVIFILSFIAPYL